MSDRELAARLYVALKSILTTTNVKIDDPRNYAFDDARFICAKAGEHFASFSEMRKCVTDRFIADRGTYPKNQSFNTMLEAWIQEVCDEG